MLTPEDVQLIRDTREEVVQLRTKSFDIIRTNPNGAVDSFTGRVGTTEEQFTVRGTWTPFTGSGTSGTDFKYVDGVEVEAGDIKANVSIDYDIKGARFVVKDGVRYAVKALEELGLGEDNRYFLLLRRVV